MRVDATPEAIDRATDRLIRLANRLLDTSRIEKGKVAPDRKETELSVLLARVVQETRSSGSDVTRNVDLRGDETAEIDQEMMMNILTVLIDNAIKYSPDGGEVDISCESIGGETVFSVADSGPGIPEKDRELVFERFYQVEDVEHHSLPDIGLGLNIATTYVDAQGGWIMCEERRGGGSTFSFGIPSPDG